MPIKKKQGEKKNDFLNRCIGVEVSSGMKTNRAVAVCNTYWEEIKLKEIKLKRRLKTADEEFRWKTFESVSGEDYTKFGLTILDLMNPKNQAGSIDENELRHDFSAVPSGFVVRYKYISNEYGSTGYSDKSRKFCKDMMTTYRDTWWSREQIESLNNADGKADRAGGKPYSVFNWRGGNNCKHIWVRYFFNEKTGEFLDSPVQPTQKSTKP